MQKRTMRIFVCFLFLTAALLLFFFVCLFLIYFWLRWVFVAVCRLSLVASSGGLLFVVVHGLLMAVASLVAEHGL